MAKDTKERILDEALRQFSQKGYDGTNIRELTASLGLVKSSMYKHFNSKEEIWNSLLDKMIAYYAEHFGCQKKKSVQGRQRYPATWGILCPRDRRLSDL